MQTVTIKVDQRAVEIVEKVIELGIARGRNHTCNIIIEAGLPKALEPVERKKKVNELIDKFMHEGLPYQVLPTVDDVEEARSR